MWEWQKDKTASYRAQRVYFRLWHSKSMLCLCLGKTFFIHLLSTGLPRHSADTVHFPDEEGGWTLCLSSDMFSTCNARSNRQISLWLWLNNSLGCEKEWSCLSLLPLFKLFPHYCHWDIQQEKILFNSLSSVSCLFYVSSLYLHFFFLSLFQSVHKRTKFSHSLPTIHLFLSLTVHAHLRPFHPIFLTHLMMWKMADMRSSL